MKKTDLNDDAILSQLEELAGSQLVVNPSQILLPDARSTNGLLLYPHHGNATKNQKPATPQIPILHSPTATQDKGGGGDQHRAAHTSPRAAEDSGQAPDYDGPATPAFLCKQTAAGQEPTTFQQ